VASGFVAVVVTVSVMVFVGVVRQQRRGELLARRPRRQPAADRRLSGRRRRHQRLQRRQ